MLSERISFVIERIPDILNFDKGRNEILTFCEELSFDERKQFLEFYSYNRNLNLSLPKYSDDEIRRFLELYSDPWIKQFLNMYLLHGGDRHCTNYRYGGDDINILIKLYLPDSYDTSKLIYTFRELSDDDKEEFLHKYVDGWRYKILKYLEFRPRWFPKYHWSTLYAFITLLMQEKEVVLSNDVKQGIGELRERLSLIYHYLRDVEAKYNDNQVLSEYYDRLYLNLSNLAHSSDDFLDRVMSNNVTAHDIHTLLQTIRDFCSNNLSSIQFNSTVNVQNNTNNGGDQILANSNIPISHSKPSNNNYSRPKTHGHVPNPHLVGFNHEIQILLHHLIQPHYETRVLGIVGPGGSGKTTLAKQIYHHPQIHSHFASKVWVCISQSWDKTTILNSIWRQATQNSKAPEMGCNQLVECLNELLSSESYLVIIDDIWSVDAWYDISPALPSGTRSKVVVTTRNKFLPQLFDLGVLIVEPKQLNYKECYELFKKRAHLDENVHHELLPLGKEMLKKCKGLPLAVIALAGVLGSDKRLSSWERISKRVTHKMLNMSNDSTQGVVKEILALSYYELPDYLKPCALYLRLFPEDGSIKAQQVTQMWIAERFMDEEDKAEEYLEELAQRSIVEVVETNHRGQVHWFQIHDLIREMFINIDIIKNPVLRLAIFGDGQKDFDSLIKILESDFNGDSHARSLIFLNFPPCCRDLELQPFFIKFKLVRVLVIDHIPRSGLPEEIGNLIHLRYLQLGGGKYELPVSIGNLENLLTLDIYDVSEDSYDTTIINLEKLKELRHLYMGYHNMVGLEKLKKLKTLRVKAQDWMSSVMPKLSDVLQELFIDDIIDEKDVELVFRTPSITSNNLRTLKLWWDWSFKVGDMSMMSKCTSIAKLELHGRIKKGTPLMFPPSLIHLEMEETRVEEKQVMNIISNSCPRLKFLFLEYKAYKGTKLVCNQNSFPRLEMLKLDIWKVESWVIEKGAIPRLNHLNILGFISSLKVNDEARELISKLAPSFIPKLTFIRRRSKRKKIGSIVVSQS